MAKVVLLRGVNVGGHRSFRPTTLAGQLDHLRVVNIGAAGTLVVFEPMTTTRLRQEIARFLPFEAEMVICEGRELLNLVSSDPLAGVTLSKEIVGFVTFLARKPITEPPLPHSLPAERGWLVRIIERRNRFAIGMYRRHMRTIGYLAAVDRMFGVTVTTRNWNTVLSIARVLGSGRSAR